MILFPLIQVPSRYQDRKNLLPRMRSYLENNSWPRHISSDRRVASSVMENDKHHPHRITLTKLATDNLSLSSQPLFAWSPSITKLRKSCQPVCQFLLVKICACEAVGFWMVSSLLTGKTRTKFLVNRKNKHTHTKTRGRSWVRHSCLPHCHSFPLRLILIQLDCVASHLLAKGSEASRWDPSSRSRQFVAVILVH